MSKPIIFSGIQPTGNLHLGNYLGAVKNWVELQNSGAYECYFCIVDYHSLTGKMTADERREKTVNVAAELLALGIDPEKSTFFIQSHVPEHTELSWIFNNLTSVGELIRMTQFKDKSGITEFHQQLPDILKVAFESGLSPKLREINNSSNNDGVLNLSVGKFKESLDTVASVVLSTQQKYEEIFNKANTGLLTYPILQAADILLYKANLVPVGQDQIQHIELTRDIARWFNKKYGDYFPETKHLVTNLPKVMSLIEPTKKMSKSLGQGHVIELLEEPEAIMNKLKKAVTATEGGGNSPGAHNLLLLFKEFGSKELHDQFSKAEKDGSIRYGDLKKELAAAIGNYFADFRQRRTELLHDPQAVMKILEKGKERAEQVAQTTMEKVRKLVGIR